MFIVFSNLVYFPTYGVELSNILYMEHLMVYTG